MTKPISVILEGQEVPCPPGASVQDLVAQHMPQRRADALAVRVDDCAIKGLRWQPQQTCRCALLDYRDEEARRMYERSARFVLLLAARAVLPGVRVRFEHSAGYGLYISLSGHVFSRRCLLRLARRMRQIVAEDMPFVRTRWSREQAMTYFEEDGQPDKVRLLGYRSYDYFDVYTCGGMCEYFYGEMLPSTGYVRSFALHRCAPGLVLSLPAPSRPDRPAPFHENPKLLRTFAQSAHWAGILGCHNAADVNDLIVKGEWRQFIRVNEALHERAIADMADHIVNRGARVLFIAGPSSSGKTTFANRLGIELRVYGAQPVAISLDDYYLSRDQVPLGPDGTPDLECLESLDVPLFNEHLRRLLHGEEVELPRFSFALGRREDVGRRMALQPGQPVIIEGIHGLNEALTGDVPGDLKYRIYISALTHLNLDDHNRIRTTDVRLLRRLVRDHSTRGADVARTLSMWDAVRAGEEKHIFPFQEQADIMFNSSLLYELPMLKRHAYPLLKTVGEESPWYLLAQRMVKFLNYFLDGEEEDEVPPTSILREFIGDCTFYTQA